MMKESSSEPVILHYGDERSRRLHYVSDTENISPRAAEERIYDCHHMKSLIHQSMTDDYLERNEKRSILMRKQQLAHFCNALENQSNFERVLALMSLEVLPTKHVKVDGNVSSSDDPCCLNIGWDDPYTISYIGNVIFDLQQSHCDCVGNKKNIHHCFSHSSNFRFTFFAHVNESLQNI